MEKYLEKKIRKYVIATFGTPTLYLKKIPSKAEYIFSEDIEYATKAMSQKIAEQIKDYYYSDTGSNVELVVLPVEITYELIDETN
jgi:hypothetical protein